MTAPTKTKAPPKRKAKAKPKTGRPTAYKVAYVKQAAVLAQMGATDIEMAAFFDVALSTFNLWKLKHPAFSESLKVGKDSADDRVVSSLYHRAIGYSHPEIDIRVVDGVIVQTPITKHYPPDPTSMIFWLKNRRKDEFRDRVDHNHGVEADNPLASLMTQMAGKVLKPVAEHD
jgi:hypothetical protein